MLLRASMIYGLAVVCVLVVVLAVWQRMELGANRETYLALTGRIERLQSDLDSARMELASAERRAAVAEDALTRARTAFGTALPGDASEERLALDLAEATRERDAARSEALALAQDLGQADQRLIEARERLESLEKQLSAQAGPAAPDPARVQAEPAAGSAPAQPAVSEAVSPERAQSEVSVNAGAEDTSLIEDTPRTQNTSRIEMTGTDPSSASDATAASSPPGGAPSVLETGSLDASPPDASPDADRLEAVAPADAGADPGLVPAADMTSRTAATTAPAEGESVPSAQPLPEVIPETAPAVPQHADDRREDRTATRDLDAAPEDTLIDEPAGEAPAAAPAKPPPAKAAKPKKKRTARKKPSTSSSDPFSIFPF